MVNHPLSSGLNKIRELEKIISIFNAREDSLTTLDRDLILEKIRGLYNEILSIEITDSKLNALPYSLSENKVELSSNTIQLENNSVSELENQNGNDVSGSNSEIKKIDINEKLSQKTLKHTLVDNHKMSPIKDLNEAIEINKKFSFLNELFKGNMQEYSQAINQLNNCKNLNEAANILQNNLEKKYDWKKNEKKELVNNLLEFLQRRYPSNRAS